MCTGLNIGVNKGHRNVFFSQNCLILLLCSAARPLWILSTDIYIILSNPNLLEVFMNLTIFRLFMLWRSLYIYISSIASNTHTNDAYSWKTSSLNNVMFSFSSYLLCWEISALLTDQPPYLGHYCSKLLHAFLLASWSLLISLLLCLQSACTLHLPHCFLWDLVISTLLSTFY